MCDCIATDRSWNLPGVLTLASNRKGSPTLTLEDELHPGRDTWRTMTAQNGTGRERKDANFCMAIKRVGGEGGLFKYGKGNLIGWGASSKNCLHHPVFKCYPHLPFPGRLSLP